MKNEFEKEIIQLVDVSESLKIVKGYISLISSSVERAKNFDEKKDILILSLLHDRGLDNISNILGRAIEDINQVNDALIDEPKEGDVE